MPYFTTAIDGGWSTDAGPTAPHLLKGEDTISIPWLIRAENLIYTTDGWIQKMPGSSKVNTAATGATDAVMGIFDYRRSTASGPAVHRRVIVAGTQIYSEDGSGTLTSLATGRQASVMPAFAVMKDKLIIAETTTTDVPASWDQTTFQNLAGSPPNFSFHVPHKRYLFAAGVDTNKSRLYYCATDDPEDWTAASSGSIDVGLDDGDEITALASLKGELIIFKGPAKGSIWRVTGSSESDWALVPYCKGVGATNHQSVVAVADDLIFWDHNGMHSFVATADYGDYHAAFLSNPIRSFFIKELNHNRFAFVWGQNFSAAGYVLWTVTRAGSTTNDFVLGWDYRFSPPRFFSWPAVAAASIGMVLDTNLETVPWFGTYTGFVLRANRPARNWAGTAYTMDCLMPYLNFGNPFFDKSIEKGLLGIVPKGETDITVGWTRDDQTQQTATISQAGTATLGPSTDQFVLGTDTLAGGRYVPRIFDMAGQFKEIQFEITKGGVDEDCEPHGLALIVEGAGLGEAAIPG